MWVQLFFKTLESLKTAGDEGTKQRHSSLSHMTVMILTVLPGSSLKSHQVDRLVQVTVAENTSHTFCTLDLLLFQVTLLAPSQPFHPCPIQLHPKCLLSWQILANYENHASKSKKPGGERRARGCWVSTFLSRIIIGPHARQKLSVFSTLTIHLLLKK